MTPPMSASSCVSDFKNFSRAGTLKKRLSTVTVVPFAPAAGRTSPILPPSDESEKASPSSVRETISVLETAAIEAIASPRNPSVWI